MGSFRDSLRPGTENLFDVIAIGLNYEGKWAICPASGSCTFLNDPPVLRAPYRSRQDAERERARILEKFRQGCRTDYWSTSLRLEVWTIGQWADALDSGQYANFFG